MSRKRIEPVSKDLEQEDFTHDYLGILFQGAWILSPDVTPGNILARCPLGGDGHEVDCGLWRRDGIGPVGDFGPIKMEPNESFTATFSKKKTYHAAPDGGFHDVFKRAAAEYPVTYLSNKPSTADQQLFSANFTSETSSVWTVSVPIPDRVIVDGVVTTAEIDGGDIHSAYRSPAVIRRPVVDLLFLYPYEDNEELSLLLTAKGETARKPATIVAGRHHKRKHLIFRVFPTSDGMACMPSKASVPKKHMMADDDCAHRFHASYVFEVLRQFIGKSTIGSKDEAGLCDLSVYHNRGAMHIGYGSTGLDQCELGLQRIAVSDRVFDMKLPACASGPIIIGSAPEQQKTPKIV